jgi:hypothetical protein
VGPSERSLGHWDVSWDCGILALLLSPFCFQALRWVFCYTTHSCPYVQSHQRLKGNGVQWLYTRPFKTISQNKSFSLYKLSVYSICYRNGKWILYVSRWDSMLSHSEPSAILQESNMVETSWHNIEIEIGLL